MQNRVCNKMFLRFGRPIRFRRLHGRRMNGIDILPAYKYAGFLFTSRQDATKRTVPVAVLLPSSLHGRTEPVRLFFSTLSAPATSAFSVQPQSWQPKCACAGRFVELVYPHLGRVWLVYFGSTRMSRPSALNKAHWMAILIP